MLAERKKGEREKRRRVNFAQIDESILSRVAMYNGRCVTVAVRCTDDFIRGNENTYTCLRAEDGRTVSSISSRTRPDIPSETSSLEYPPPREEEGGPGSEGFRSSRNVNAWLSRAGALPAVY